MIPYRKLIQFLHKFHTKFCCKKYIMVTLKKLHSTRLLHFYMSIKLDRVQAINWTSAITLIEGNERNIKMMIEKLVW